MAQLVHSNPQVMIVPTASPSGKDSRWLTLEVCREFQRSKCSRTDTECKFAHPPPHVEVQNGRVVACFDSIKGKCQRKDPPCKYLHPPQHLREQLLQNGRNNLILKNLQLQTYQPQYASMMPVAYETGGKAVAVSAVMPGQYTYLSHYPGLQTLSAVPAQAPTATYSPYLQHFASLGMPANADPTSIMSQQLQQNMLTAKAIRADKFETSADINEAMTTHASLMDSFSYPTYFTQQSAGMVPTYKRIALSDFSKGGFPMYQTNPLLSPYQHTSLMQLQQQPSYIPVSYTFLYPPDATLGTPTATNSFIPHHLTAGLTPNMVSTMPYTSTTPPVSSAIPTITASTSMSITTTSSNGDNIMTSPSGLNLYMINKGSASSSISSTHGATRAPSIPNNAYYVEYFGNNKQLLDTLQVCQEFRSGLCDSPYCKLVHLSEDYVEVTNNQVTVCRDFATRQTCRRSRCKYYHIPVELPPS